MKDAKARKMAGAGALGQWAAGRPRTLNRLARGIARAGGVLPILDPSPPTIAAPSTTSAVAGTLWGPATAGAFQYLRGTWELAGGSYPLNLFYQAKAVHYGDGTEGGVLNSYQEGAAPLVRFWSDAADLEIYNLTGGTTTSAGYRLRVDGKYVQTGALGLLTPAANGSPRFTRITWGDGSATYRKPRLYELEGIVIVRFGGVKLPNTARAWAASDPDGLRVILHGDSFAEYTGSTTGALHGPMGAQIAALLGQSDVTSSGVGASGWLANGSGTRNTFGQRVQADVIARAPDVVIDIGGLNDTSFVTAQAAAFEAAVQDWVSRIVTALPNVLIFMTGPMSQSNPPSARSAVRDIKATVAARFPANVVFIDNLAEAWVTGTGRSGAPAGDGNADWATGGADGTDVTHPTDAGYTYLARRIVNAIAQRIPAV